MITIRINGENKRITRIQYYELVSGQLVERTMKSVHYGARLIWNGIRSCFGAGYWIQSYPWLNDDTWKY